ncbi:MAG: IS1380 family transposase [Terracidiphilus sp.]
MTPNIRRFFSKRKSRIQRRLDKKDLRGCSQPILTPQNIQYEVADRTRGISYGGLGAIQLLARKLGLIEAIDNRLHLLKIHLPYHESDHVLAIAYNALCEGSCLQDLELRRNDEVFLDALGARRIPDPTTAGDFCRRFTTASLDILQDIFDDTRIKAWEGQPDAFFQQAIIDMDGTLVGTTGQCKKGMDIAYDGTWGYHVLVLSLANTSEILRLVNRPANRPSHEGAAAQVDRALEVCFRGQFRRVLLRGDTDFSQTEHLDRWNSDRRVRFVFGYDANPAVKEIAERLPALAWRPLERPPQYTVKTQPRARPDNVKEQVVVAREFENIRLESEEVAEFNYQPHACSVVYRMVVVRKNLSVSKGERLESNAVRYFFYLTNDWVPDACEVVFVANDRCHQENLLSQLHSGVKALRAPLGDLESNGAYMVMVALAWNLKVWWGLSLPEVPGRWQEQHREDKQRVLGMEFKTFVNAFVRLPCQIVKTGKKLIYRLLSWNPHLGIFFRMVSALRC